MKWPFILTPLSKIMPSEIHGNETLAVAIAIIAIFSAMWDAEISFIIAFVALLFLLAYNSGKSN